LSDFEEFPKMARLSRRIIITEKIDGTNAQVFIGEDGSMRFGSRSRWITPEDDNYGFARWATENADELRKLGPGRHFGEWWGAGIQRGYGLKEKRFSLFNTIRWANDRPACCHVVPVLFDGIWEDLGEPSIAVDALRQNGSLAAPGFMKPEGIVIYHVAGNVGFKKTLEKDEMSKGEAERLGKPQELPTKEAA
jgi:hypothetical protein